MSMPPLKGNLMNQTQPFIILRKRVSVNAESSNLLKGFIFPGDFLRSENAAFGLDGPIV